MLNFQKINIKKSTVIDNKTSKNVDNNNNIKINKLTPVTMQGLKRK